MYTGYILQMSDDSHDRGALKWSTLNEEKKGRPRVTTKEGLLNDQLKLEHRR